MDGIGTRHADVDWGSVFLLRSTSENQRINANCVRQQTGHNRTVPGLLQDSLLTKRAARICHLGTLITTNVVSKTTSWKAVLPGSSLVVCCNTIPSWWKIERPTSPSIHNIHMESNVQLALCAVNLI